MCKFVVRAEQPALIKQGSKMLPLLIFVKRSQKYYGNQKIIDIQLIISE